jgi:hypothetical protein
LDTQYTVYCIFFVILTTLLFHAKEIEFNILTELSEPERREEVARMLPGGNHKSAQDSHDKTEALIHKDVKHGFVMPCTRDIGEELPGAMVQPCGLARQFTLLEDGSRTQKYRLTHDLSYSADKTGTSVNDRIGMDRYPAMSYGWCLLRVIHFIVALREAHPDKKIFISKYDFSDAYKRMAHSARLMT